MRVSREKAAENRQRIVAAAARLFRETGFDGAGVDAIMQAAGLTHGGFYGHFRSKEDLAAEAVRQGLAAGAERMAGACSLRAYADGYLSAAHCADRGGGCMVAALGEDGAPGRRRAPRADGACTGGGRPACIHVRRRRRAGAAGAGHRRVRRHGRRAHPRPCRGRPGAGRRDPGRRAGGLRRGYARPTSRACLIGSERIRVPVASKIAFASAGRDRRRAGLADPAPFVAARQRQMRLDPRRIGHPHHLVGVEVALLDTAFWRS